MGRLRVGTFFGLLLLAGSAAALAGCTAMTPTPKVHPTVTLEPGEPWRNVATVKDEQSLGRLRARWTEALAQARKAGFLHSVERQGVLLEPLAALPRPAPSPGAYTCRLVTLGVSGVGGAAQAGGKAFVAGRSAFCFVGVQDGQLSFTADLTPIRIGGYLWEQDGAAQLTFLGSSARGKGVALPAYGKNPENGVPGVFERIGEFRYRLVLASPVLGGQIAFLELRPVVPVQGLSSPF